MNKIIKRLQIISQLISIWDIDLIEAQIDKIDVWNNKEVEVIINFINEKNYSKAVNNINNFISKNQWLIVFEDIEIDALKLEIINLENEITDLETNKIEMERVIHDFEVKHHNELGDLILKILKIKKEKLKTQLEENKDDENKNLYEEAKKDYEEFKWNYNEVNNEKIFTLNDDEKNELKSKFRKACHLCHPDKFKDNQKEFAQKIFIDLKNAYEKNDIKKVNEIYESLLDWNLTNKNPSTDINKKQELVLKLNILRNKKQDLIREVILIEMSDTYKEISQIKDYDKYFKNQKKLLEKELVSLK